MEAQVVIVAELLVTGLGAAVWVGSLIGSIYGIEWLARASLTGWELPLTLVGLALVYALGVLIVGASCRFSRVSSR